MIGGIHSVRLTTSIEVEHRTWGPRECTNERVDFAPLSPYLITLHLCEVLRHSRVGKNIESVVFTRPIQQYRFGRSTWLWGMFGNTRSKNSKCRSMSLVQCGFWSFVDADKDTDWTQPRRSVDLHWICFESFSVVGLSKVGGPGGRKGF